MTLADAFQPLPECPVEPPATQEILLAEDLIPVIADLMRNMLASLTPDAALGNGKMGLSYIVGESTMRTANRILGGESVIVELDTADKLITAFGGNLTTLIPEEHIYVRPDVNQAQKLHTELLYTVARCRGEYVPPPGQRRAWPEAMRRKLAKAARAA